VRALEVFNFSKMGIHRSLLVQHPLDPALLITFPVVIISLESLGAAESGSYRQNPM
jgi:hypothetical protein